MREAEQRAGLNEMDTTQGMNQYGPVDARVYIHSPNSWYQRVTINKGTDDGVHRGDPVINGAGLVGKVLDVTSGDAVVTLLTDQSFATGVITGEGRHAGSITPAVGAPGVLVFEPVETGARVRENDLVYTAGTTDSRLQSRYPAGIVIGKVSRISLGDGDLDRRIHVEPAADLLRLDMVQVLTEPQADLDPDAK
jgi:rod shape-determining protein MreC